ncbi:unnamed protein product [Cercopithifilaria johnstoni]|uniref:Uncharacterized protein n=1 Tax=Cercopithifilaria johnstoni TaxID=2874296 RepID=A0A8J2LUL2_9BILA|nr:unnamed protein product [Cercopithifilaria johnstoni]
MEEAIQTLKNEANGKLLRRSWVDNNDDDNTIVKMNPIATDKNKFQAVILHDEPFADSSSLNQINSPAISVSESSASKITITSTVPNTRTIRERIKQKVIEEIEVKRETAQLNKRLQRQQRNTLMEQNSVGTVAEVNQEELDRQIEHSIKLGEKCTADCIYYLPPDDVQYEFMTGQSFQNNPKTEIKQKQTSKVNYMAAQVQSPDEIKQFESLCCFYNKGYDATASSSIENIPTFKLQNYALLSQRVGEHFLNDDGIVLGSNLDIDRIPKRPERYDDDYRIPCRYIKAEKWDKALSRIKQQEFIQLDIDLNRIVFNYHWLFGQEDLLCSTIRNLHKMQSIRMQEALKLLKEIETKEKILRNGTVPQKNEKENAECRIRELMIGLEEKQQNYLDLGNMIEKNWIKLQKLRQIQKYSTTTLTVKKISFEQQHAEKRFE